MAQFSSETFLTSSNSGNTVTPLLPTFFLRPRHRRRPFCVRKAGVGHTRKTTLAPQNSKTHFHKNCFFFPPCSLIGGRNALKRARSKVRTAEGRKRASGGAESALAQGLCAERSGVGQRMNRQRSGGCGAGAPSSAKRFFFSIQHLGFHLDLQDWLGRGEFWVFLPSSAECKTRFVFCTWSRE